MQVEWCLLHQHGPVVFMFSGVAKCVPSQVNVFLAPLGNSVDQDIIFGAIATTALVSLMTVSVHIYQSG